MKKQYGIEQEAIFAYFEAFSNWTKLADWEDQQDYKFTALLYPDCTSYVNGRTAEDILTMVRNWGYKEWYYILHDRDIKADGEPKKPHYHVMIKTSTPSKLGTIAHQLGIPSNYVQRVKSWKSMAKYLLHDECQDKAMYLADEVVCLDTQQYLKYFDSASEAEDAQKILGYIIETGCSSYIQLIEWACKNDLYATVRRNASMWTGCIRENQHWGGKTY